VCAVNSSVLHRRRIERYAQLLDEASGARRHHSRSPIDDELSDLVAVGNRLTAATPEVTVRPEFRRDTRAFLLAVAAREGMGKTAVAEPAVGRAQVVTGRATVRARAVPKSLMPKPKSSTGRLATGRGRAAILVGLAVGTLALSGISAASGDAMPGDTLYGMKRSAENAQLALAGSNVSKGDLYLDFARTRLSEAQAVHTDAKAVIGVLNDMDAQTILGAKLLFTDALKSHNNADLKTVDQFLADQAAHLNDLRADLPRAAADRALRSINTLNRISVRSSAIEAAPTCSSLSMEKPDDLGAQPSCQESTTITPNATSSQPSGKGKSSKSGGHSSVTTTTPDEASVPTITTPALVAPTTTSQQPTPSPSPTDDGGLLGAVQHLLGGL
jgi:hypothetical protein